jgi:hypothetical protein
MKMISKLPLVILGFLVLASLYLNYQDLERVDWNLKYPFMTEKEVEDFRRKKEVKKIELLREENEAAVERGDSILQQMRIEFEKNKDIPKQDPYDNLSPDLREKMDRMRKMREQRLKEKRAQEKQ